MQFSMSGRPLTVAALIGAPTVREGFRRGTERPGQRTSFFGRVIRSLPGRGSHRAVKPK
ncbi:hypothetical protein SBA6_1000001 [Candidatus Sulfopaludibacter sp. SbA6]|nr:hypothetical protein SBA6_1000001 [Candidatus Sulfopaludibacter sp. SbA6]